MYDDRDDQSQKGGKQQDRDLSNIQCFRCDKYGHFASKCPDRLRNNEPERVRNHESNLNQTREDGVDHEEGTFFMMNSEAVFLNEEKYTPPKLESQANEEGMWYLDNGASNHMTGNYSYFSELNKRIVGKVKFGDESCVDIEGKGSILFEGKNGEQKLLKNVYYIPSLKSNVISLGEATISGCDIRLRGDFLAMRDSLGRLLMRVQRSENRLYKIRLVVGKSRSVQQKANEPRSLMWGNTEVPTRRAGGARVAQVVAERCADLEQENQIQPGLINEPEIDRKLEKNETQDPAMRNPINVSVKELLKANEECKSEDDSGVISGQSQLLLSRSQDNQKIRDNENVQGKSSGQAKSSARNDGGGVNRLIKNNGNDRSPTKAFAKVRFVEMRKKLGVRELPPQPFRG